MAPELKQPDLTDDDLRTAFRQQCPVDLEDDVTVVLEERPYTPFPPIPAGLMTP